MTVLEVIQRSGEFLGRKGVESPRLHAEWLLAHVLRLPRMRLYLDFERILTETELDAMRELVRRRGEREPLQHLLGTASFCGLDMSVTRDVLIPRPETELLAERAVERVRARAAAGAAPAVLDFGTGSGCLAIVIAARCPEARVDAVDISEAALAIARQNAARHGLAERIRFLAGDGFEVVPAGAAYDVIVANPPYIPTGELAGLQPEVRDYDPRLALDGGADGLDFYRRLAAAAGGWMRPGGRWLMEVGDGQAGMLREWLPGAGWQVEAVERDDTGRERIVIAHRLD